jgi:hypothetical protein
MPRVRNALHAGSWYEDDGERLPSSSHGNARARVADPPPPPGRPGAPAGEELASQIDGWLGAVEPRQGPPVRAIIAP